MIAPPNLGKYVLSILWNFNRLSRQPIPLMSCNAKSRISKKRLPLYQGDFLKEDRLAEWTTFEREKMKRAICRHLCSSPDCRNVINGQKQRNICDLLSKLTRVYEETHIASFRSYVPDNDRAESTKMGEIHRFVSKEYGKHRLLRSGK